jgi:hypothetical protein
VDERRRKKHQHPPVAMFPSSLNLQRWAVYDRILPLSQGATVTPSAVKRFGRGGLGTHVCRLELAPHYFWLTSSLAVGSVKLRNRRSKSPLTLQRPLHLYRCCAFPCARKHRSYDQSDFSTHVATPLFGLKMRIHVGSSRPCTVYKKCAPSFIQLLHCPSAS